MKQKLVLNIPTSWADITLKKYLALQSDLENYRDDEDAQTALMLNHLCGLEPEYLTKLSVDNYNNIKLELNQFITPNGLPLQRFIKMDGIEYGFEPNLAKMSYGAYTDITQYETVSIDKNWPKIMSILYRPVTKHAGDMYQIEAYEGIIDEEKWLDVTMDIHFGTMFFFVHTSMDLMKNTLNSLTEMELHPSTKSILEKSGKLMQQLWNSPMGTSKK